MAELKRITINLTSRGSDSLESAMLSTGDNQTDTIHRALALYAYAMQALDAGGRILVDHAGESDPVELLVL